MIAAINDELTIHALDTQIAKHQQLCATQTFSQ